MSNPTLDFLTYISAAQVFYILELRNICLGGRKT